LADYSWAAQFRLTSGTSFLTADIGATRDSITPKRFRQIDAWSRRPIERRREATVVEAAVKRDRIPARQPAEFFRARQFAAFDHAKHASR